MKFAREPVTHFILKSHPTRGGWIEMETALATRWITRVPPHKGWVD